MRIIISISLSLLSLGLFAQNPVTIPGLLEKLKGMKEDSMKVKTLFSIGRLYDHDEQFDSSLFYCSQALEIAKKVNYQKGIGNAYNNMAITYFNHSNYYKSNELYLKALEVFENNRLFRDGARTLMNIAIVHTEQRDYKSALEKLAQAKTMNEKVNDTVTLVFIFSNMGHIHNLLRDFTGSKEYLTRGLELAAWKLAHKPLSMSDSLPIVQGKFLMEQSLGISLLETGKYEQSISVFKKLLDEISDRKGIRSKVEILELLADNNNRLRNFKSALENTDTALVLLKTDSIPESYRDLYEQRSIAYEGLGMYKEAIGYRKLFKTFNDSILNRDNLANTGELLTKYETEKKDREIVQLSQEKQAQRIIINLSIGAAIVTLGLLFLALRSRRLQKKLFIQKEQLIQKEKEIEKKMLEKKMNELEQMALRAQMNPHFIFNSLNSVQHFVMKHDIEGANKYLGAFAHLVRQTLNNSGKPFISLDEEIKYLDTYLSLEKTKSNDRFNYTFTVSENVDRFTTFVPGMILQPFVENSIKHGLAYKDNNDGMLNISFSGNEKLVCVIEDNGVGRQKADELKLATAGQEYESKGMSITMSRIDTINKIYNTDISVQIDDVKDSGGSLSGTRVTVEFPEDLE